MRLFDLHCDTLYETHKNGDSLVCNKGQLDLQRGMTFSPWYQCFAVWVGDDTPAQTAQILVQQMIQKAYITQQQFPKLFSVLQDPNRFFRTPSTPCTAVLTVENGGVAAGQDAFPLWWLSVGVKMVSLTWNGANRWAEGCFGNPKKGLTVAGKKAVSQMKQNGILIDLSHLNRYGFEQIVEQPGTPPVVSHTASNALCNTRRNLTDRQFYKLKQKGGLVGIDLCEQHLGKQTLSGFIAHLEHFLALGGERTVCLGGDLDGIRLPQGWNGIHIYEELYNRLLQRNYAESLVDDIFYDNAYRFFKKHCS